MKKSILQIITAAAIAAAFLTACGQKAAAPEITPSENGSGQAQSSEAGGASAEAPENTADDDQAAPNDGAQTGQEDAAAPLPGDSIGQVSFTPNEKGYSMVYGSNTLHAYFQRQDVVPGSGKMTVKKLSDDSVVEEIDLKDATKCAVGEQDSTFSLLGWDGGTHLIIYLKDLPESGETYYVNLEEGAFTSADGKIRSRAVTDPSTWCYGVAGYGVLPSAPSGSAVYVGDVLTADVLVRQPAVLARIENYDENRVRFNEKEFEQDGKLDIKIYQIGEDSFTVTFFDRDDNPIGSITLSYTASMPPEPEQEAPRKSVTDL